MQWVSNWFAERNHGRTVLGGKTLRSSWRWRFNSSYIDKTGVGKKGKAPQSLLGDTLTLTPRTQHLAAAKTSCDLETSTRHRPSPLPGGCALHCLEMSAIVAVLIYVAIKPFKPSSRHDSAKRWLMVPGSLDVSSSSDLD
ncbi:hypothetical protein J6590_081497 [Homalodisca vitripennis]|nr:hypothetical protein J6590_081497 [Homalodisca vitripennis]